MYAWVLVFVNALIRVAWNLCYSFIFCLLTYKLCIYRYMYIYVYVYIVRSCVENSCIICIKILYEQIAKHFLSITQSWICWNVRTYGCLHSMRNCKHARLYACVRVCMIVLYEKSFNSFLWYEYMYAQSIRLI